MRSHPLRSQRWGLACLTVLVLAVAAGACKFRRQPVLVRAAAKDDTKIVLLDRNLVNTTDKNLSLDFAVDPQEKNVLWKAKLGRTSYAGPVLGAGKVFVGTNNQNPRDPTFKEDAGVVMCFDAKTGKFLWQSVHPILNDAAQNHPLQGIASTPFVDGDRVYYVSNRCELVCADVNGDPVRPGKAKILWTYDMIKELKVFPSQLATSSPLVVGDLVYAITGNGWEVQGGNFIKLPNPDAPSFVAIEKNTGKLKWSDASPGKNVMEGQWTSPTYARPKNGKSQILFPGGDGWLYSFEPDTGKLIWKFNCNPKDAVFNLKNKRLTDKAYFMATPVVYEDRVYIGMGCNPEEGPGAGPGVSHLWCIDITKKGDVSPRDQKFDPKDPANKDSALVWHFGGKIDPEPEKGRDIYFGRTMSTCSIHDGLLYLGELDGYFHCFDARTGKHHWEVDMQAGTWASPYWVDGKVFIGNDDGEVHVYEHGKNVKRLAKIGVGHRIKTPIKVADGVFYILTDKYLHACGKK